MSQGAVSATSAFGEAARNLSWKMGVETPSDRPKPTRWVVRRGPPGVQPRGRAYTMSA